MTCYGRIYLNIVLYTTVYDLCQGERRIGIVILKCVSKLGVVSIAQTEQCVHFTN